jgi:hypothetical protein
MDIPGYWISVGYGCLSIQIKKRLSISNPVLSKSVDIRLSDYPIGALRDPQTQLKLIRNGSISSIRLVES